MKRFPPTLPLYPKSQLHEKTPVQSSALCYTDLVVLQINGLRLASQRWNVERIACHQVLQFSTIAPVTSPLKTSIEPTLISWTMALVES